MRDLKSIIYNVATIILLINFPTKLFAQSSNGKVEVKLNLLEQKNEKGIDEYALGVSFINHLNEDIYIPNFRLFASYSGVHFYQKEDNKWVEINIDSHDYVQLSSIQRKDGTTVIVEKPNDTYLYSENALAKQYRESNSKLNLKQDSITKAIYKSAPDHHGLSIFESYGGDGPLFLKANQRIDNYLVRSLSYLSTKKLDYKIAFNSEPRDSIKYYKDSTMYVNHIQSYGRLHYQKNIDGYELFYPQEIISNVIYFTPKVIIQK